MYIIYLTNTYTQIMCVRALVYIYAYIIRNIIISICSKFKQCLEI